MLRHLLITSSPLGHSFNHFKDMHTYNHPRDRLPRVHLLKSIFSGTHTDTKTYKHTGSHPVGQLSMRHLLKSIGPGTHNFLKPYPRGIG